MNKIILIIFLTSLLIFPQESNRYFDAPFGGGGGYTPGWYIPKMDLINQKVKAFGVPDLSTSGFYTSGGAGFIYLGLIPGIRIGGMGYGGSSSEAVSGTPNKEVIYSLSGGGFTVEYTLPFVKNVGISVGAIIGGGSLSLEIYQNADTYQWDDIWNTPPVNNTDISRTLTNSYWIISPTINIDIPFYRFAMFRIGAGYQFSLGDEWSIDNDMELSGVPNDLNGNSFFIQSGIFVGFFSF